MSTEAVRGSHPLRRPDLLLIGSSGRNVGKTELACRVIANLAAGLPVVGIKITTVSERDGTCPRGGAGCGVCSSLTDAWCITREDSGPATDSRKDTARLLAAGARRVYWLRVLRENLREGLEDLFARVERESAGGIVPLVAESNSARTVLVPGLFLMIRDDAGGREGAGSFKPSSKDVLGYADRIIRWDGKGHDLDPAAIVFRNGRWEIREN